MRVEREIGFLGFLGVALVASCQRGGRLVDLRKTLEQELARGDTVAAADTLLSNLNNALVASSLVMEDVGAEALDSASLALVAALASSGTRSAELGDLPDAWAKAYMSLRITERYYDLKPKVARQMTTEATGLLRAASNASLARARHQAGSGDTLEAFNTLDEASFYLNTSLPQPGIQEALSSLHRQKAALGLALGKPSSGMSTQEVISIMGPPLSRDSVYAALSGDFGLLLSWDTVAALVKGDTVRDVINLPGD